MASEQEEKKTVVLKSNDGQTFEVAKEAASLSETISQTIEDDVGDEVPLPLVSGNILAKIIEYCNKHTESDTATKGKEKADGDDAGKIISNSKKNPLKDWDKEYINMDIDQLFELVKVPIFQFYFVIIVCVILYATNGETDLNEWGALIFT